MKNQSRCKKFLKFACITMKFQNRNQQLSSFFTMLHFTNILYSLACRRLEKIASYHYLPRVVISNNGTLKKSQSHQNFAAREQKDGSNTQWENLHSLGKQKG